MAVAGHILLWILYILLGLLAFVLVVVLLVSLTPVKVCIHYGADGLRVRLGVLFYHRQLVPVPPPKVEEKPEKPKKPPKSKKTPKPRRAKSQKKTVPAAVKPPEKVTPEKAPAKTTAETAPGNAAAQLQDWLEQTAEGPVGNEAPPDVRPAASGRPGPDAQPAGGQPVFDKKTAVRPPSGPDQHAVPKKQKPKKSDKKAAPKVADTSGQPAEKTGPVDVQALLEHLPEVVGAAGHFIGAVLRSLHFQNLYVMIPVSGGLPDAVARRVGRANAWFYAITARLQTCLRLRWRKVCIFPDYDGQKKDSLCLEGAVRGCALPVLIAALYLYRDLKKAKIL